MFINFVFEWHIPSIQHFEKCRVGLKPTRIFKSINNVQLAEHFAGC